MNNEQQDKEHTHACKQDSFFLIDVNVLFFTEHFKAATHTLMFSAPKHVMFYDPKHTERETERDKTMSLAYAMSISIKSSVQFY